MIFLENLFEKGSQALQKLSGKMVDLNMTHSFQAGASHGLIVFIGSLFRALADLVSRYALTNGHDHRVFGR